MSLLDTFYTQLMNNLIIYAPNILLALAILIVGYVLGKIVDAVLKAVLKKSNIDKYIKKPNLPKISDFVPFVCKWYVYLAFISAAFSQEVLGIPMIAFWVASIMSFIPNVIGAAIILFVGYIFGQWFKDTITIKKNVYAEITGNTVLFFVMYVALAMALQLLSISTTLIETILVVVVASVGLGLAIALGLGLKDVVREVSFEFVRAQRAKSRKK